MSSNENVSSEGVAKPSRVLNKNHGFMRLILHNQLNRSEYDKFYRERQEKIRAVYESSSKINSQATPRTIPRYRIPSRRQQPTNERCFIEREPADPYNHLRQQIRRRIEAEHKKQTDVTNESNHLVESLGNLTLKS